VIAIRQLSASNRFGRDLQDAPADIQAAALKALNRLRENPAARSLRLHSLSGYPKPMLWKIDVFANHSWQITFELEGDAAVLKRLGTHRDVDRDPRG